MPSLHLHKRELCSLLKVIQGNPQDVFHNTLCESRRELLAPEYVLSSPGLGFLADRLILLVQAREACLQLCSRAWGVFLPALFFWGQRNPAWGVLQGLACQLLSGLQKSAGLPLSAHPAQLWRLSHPDRLCCYRSRVLLREAGHLLIQGSSRTHLTGPVILLSGQ